MYMLWNTARVFFEQILDTVFPLSNRVRRVRAHRDDPLVIAMHTTSLNGKSVHTLCSYSNTAVKDAIGAAKFEESTAAMQQLAHVLDDFLIDAALEHAYAHEERIIVVPVPLHRTREQARGYNQMDAILTRTRAVSEGFVEYAPDILARLRHTTPQATLTRAERLTNVLGAFACAHSEPQRLRERTIYIVDDVATTGATLAAAGSSLSPHCPCVELVAIARA